MDTCTILAVDDDENDQLFLRLAFKEAGISNPIRQLGNGVEAIKYLNGEPPYSNRKECPLPCLMLLDLKMPLCNGLEVLAWRQKHTLKDFPVVVFSSSSQTQDINKAMELGATSYLIKPTDLLNLVTLAKEIRAEYLERTKNVLPFEQCGAYQTAIGRQNSTRALNRDLQARCDR